MRQSQAQEQKRQVQVVTVTDAKNLTITNFYDKASRPTKRTYSDGTTPEVEYFYDGKGLSNAPAFSRGALTKVTNSVSEDRFTSFDNHGRLLASQQITDGQTYDFKYKYNISGGLLEETYPSGRVVRNFLDNDGGLSLVTSKAGNSGQIKQVASNFDYSAVGSVKKVKLGNGLWETTQVNERYQLTQVGLGTTNANNNLFKIDYEYGELNDNGTVDTARNIGMIAKTTTTIPTTSFVQTFKYDAINRLKEAKEVSTNTPTTDNWKQTFDYDRFGNRTNFYQKVGTTVLAINNITKPTIDQSNNQFTTGQGYVYDFNGNLIQDAEGRTFTFDGNNKQIEVKETNAPTYAPKVGRYFYNASGRRVKKITQIETTVFVYDASGVLVAEYSTVTPPTTPTTSYMTTDHLGSPRVITDQNGQVINRRDFMPFGEEISRVNSGNDLIRKKFTGYQKDDETQLDFAEARMYQNKHARFTAVDPLMASASPTNPQTFNRYSYTGNNPINYTDPSGLSYCQSSSGPSFDWRNGACKEGETTLDETPTEITKDGCTSNGKCFTKGSLVILHGNGSVTVIKKPTDAQKAVAQGKVVAKETVTVSNGTAEQLVTTESSNVGNTITNRATEPVPNSNSSSSSGTNSSIPEPPISPAGLDYSRSAQKIIDEHINGNDMIQSQYIFTPYERFLNIEFERVMEINDTTYTNGRGFRQDNGNTAYVYAFPDYEMRIPGLTIVTNTMVGKDVEMGNDLTNSNTVVIGRDGKTVMTSHPGLPSYIDPNNPPRGVGTPFWKQSNWRRPGGIILPEFPYKY
jgi:RHS repeat-associated protein